MSDQEYADDLMVHLREALTPLLASTDSRLMFTALCAFSNAMGERLIAAGVLTPENVIEHYEACVDCARNTVPNTEKPTIKYISNGQLIDKNKLS